MSDAVELLRSQIKELEPIWRDFKPKRDASNDVIRRRTEVQLEPELKAYARGINIQSTDAQRGLLQMIAICKMNPTKIDLVSLNQGKQAKDDVEDIRVWDGCQWRRLNDKREIDSARFEAMMRYGVAVEREYWDMPAEYDQGDEELAEGLSEEDAAASKKTAADKREAYFQGLNSDQWKVATVNPLECKWLPVNSHPELFLQQSEVSYVDATKLQDSEGKFFSLDAANKIAFLSERQPLGSVHGEAKITVTTRAMKDKDTGKWKLAEFVTTGDGQSANDDGAQLSETDVPFKTCPFKVIPAGTELLTETDPHLRYVPPVQDLVVAVNERNYHLTRIAALVIKYSTNFYIDLSSLPANQAALLEELFPVEGQGANRRLVVPMPDPGSNEVPAMLHIERLPFEIDEAMKWVLEQNQKAIDDAMPSRFQTGEVSRVETAESTATTMVNLMQQSSLPWESHLANADGYGTAAILEDIHQCILYWDDEVEGEAVKPYYTASTGEEPLLKGAPDPGTQVSIDANKLRRPFQLIVQTMNKTQAEKQQDLVTTMQLSAKGWVSEEQGMSGKAINWPFEDPRKQLEVMEAERQRLDLEPYKRQMINSMNQKLFMALLGGMPAPGPQGAPQDLAASAVTKEGPGGEATQVKTNQPLITPSPVQMQGGSNGSVPVGP